MEGQKYIDELAGVVALPCLMDCSLLDFARRIRIQIEDELKKISPDNALIALLSDAARLGWEQIKWANTPSNITKWINKKYSVPEESSPMEIKKVLVWYRGYHKIGWRTKYSWHIEGSPSDFTDEIQYWMPLPIAPTIDS